MTPLLALLAAQAATPQAPERFSILVPVAPQKCAPRQVREEQKDDVVVCATDLPDQTVPYPEEYVHNGPRPSNPDLSGTAALTAAATPCAATQSGCQAGLDVLPLLFKGAAALVDEVKHAARKRDKRPRVPIDLSEPPAKRP